MDYSGAYYQSYKRILLHIVTPLLLGVSIYVFFRGTIFFNLLKYLGWEAYVSNVKNILGIGVWELPYWFKFSLPGGLWVYAFMSAILFNWSYSINKQSFIWVAFVLLFSLVYEVSQYFEIVEGFYDLSDLLTNMGALGLAGFQWDEEYNASSPTNTTYLHFFSLLIVIGFAGLAIVSNGPADVLRNFW